MEIKETTVLVRDLVDGYRGSDEMVRDRLGCGCFSETESAVVLPHSGRVRSLSSTDEPSAPQADYATHGDLSHYEPIHTVSYKQPYSQMINQ